MTSNPTPVPVYNATGGSNTWRTPPAFVHAVERLLGARFALDCAASPGAEVAPRSWTPADDALTKSWAADGPRWLNPPYSRQCLTCPDGEWRKSAPPHPGCRALGHASRDVDEWIAKAAAEGTAPGCWPLTMLVPYRPDTAWYHDQVARHAHVVYAVRGRLRFLLGDGSSATAGAPFPSLVAIFAGPMWSRRAGRIEPLLHGRMDKDGRVLEGRIDLSSLCPTVNGQEVRR